MTICGYAMRLVRSLQLVNVRLLALTLKRFFNTLKSKPVSVNQTIRIVHQYENLFRIVRWSTRTGGLNMTALGREMMVKIPVGEIWIVEYMQASRTTGSNAEFDGFYVRLAGTSSDYVISPQSAAAIVRARRGIDFGENWWFYPGDTLYANVSTEYASEYGEGYILRRVLRVGDDY